MSVRLRLSFGGVLVAAAFVLALFVTTASAQIKTDIIEKYRAELQKQSTDPEMKRERGTQPQDWLFSLPEGVTSRQITFYSDGTPCYGRIFFPKGFTTRGKWPAVVVGHGINAQAVGIEKYAARFAERGLVAMAIDYRTYGYSGGDVLLLEPDTTTDERAVWEKETRIRIKRTNLNNFRETEDFRAAISYIQTEPGVDPERIGVWGSSNGASVVLMVAALDARVKAVVAQVGGAGGLGASGPVAISPQMLEDGIRRARTGQGAEVDGGFSFRSKIDLWSSQVNREFRPAALLDRIPETTKLLWIPAEKDELIPPRGVQAASKAFKGTSQIVEVPYLTHFQIYSYTGFEVSSNLAADWFLKYLGNDPAQNVPSTPAEAYERAMEPLREFFKSKEPTLEDNLKAHKEKERRAKEYAGLFKLVDWKGEQLFSLAQIYGLAGQPAEAEKALGIYLLDPAAAKARQARISLLDALVAQKKFADAAPIADRLLDEPKYNQDIIFKVQSLIDVLRKSEIKRAIAIAEKMAPKLFQYAESNAGIPGHAGLVLGMAIELGVMYRESGDQAKAEEYFAAFHSKFNASSLASVPRVKEMVEAAMFRLKLVGSAAPAIEGVEYLGLPKLQLSDLKGKVILLDFLAHWCGPCIASIPETNSLKEKYEANGLVIIGLTNYYGFFGEREKLTNAEELAALKDFLLKRNVRFGVIVGPRANEAAYGVAGLPAVALIDRQGTVRYIKQGADYKKEIEKMIQTLVAEPAPKQEEKSK